MDLSRLELIRFRPEVAHATSCQVFLPLGAFVGFKRGAEDRPRYSQTGGPLPIYWRFRGGCNGKRMCRGIQGGGVGFEHILY